MQHASFSNVVLLLIFFLFLAITSDARLSVERVKCIKNQKKKKYIEPYVANIAQWLVHLFRKQKVASSNLAVGS